MFENQPPSSERQPMEESSGYPHKHRGYSCHPCAAQLRVQSGLLALTVIINILLLYLFQTAGAWLLMSILHAVDFSLFSMEAVNELFTMTVYIVAFFLPYLVYAKATGFNLRSIGQDLPYPPVLAASTGISLGLSVVGIIASMMIASFFSLFGLYPMQMPLYLPNDAFAMALFMLNTTVVPALIEEFVNRGILLGSLRRYGDQFAIVISALIFALLHRNMTQFPNALLLGLALGYFVVQTNSIWTGICIHFINNLLVLLVTIFTFNSSDIQSLLVQGGLFVLYLAAGAVGAYYLLVVRKASLTLRRSDCPLREGTLYRIWLLHFPTLMMLALFVWVIYLNFVKG